MASPHILQAKVASPEGILFEGETIAISGENHEGRFAILPGHANFVSIIHKKIVMHTSKQDAQEITIESGILACRNNKVDVYVGITDFSKETKTPYSSQPRPASQQREASKHS